MENRKTFFFEKYVFCAAIFLDPRINFLGPRLISESQKLIAITHLEKTYNQLNSMKGRPTANDSIQQDSLSDNQSSPSMSSQVSDEPVPTPRSKMEAILALSYPDETTIGLGEFSNKLREMCNRRRLNADVNVLEYFKYIQYSDKDLYTVVNTVLAVPSTQVTVERAFSMLRIILSDKRCNISEDHLEKTLIINLNRDIFDRIDIM